MDLLEEQGNHHSVVVPFTSLKKVKIDHQQKTVDMDQVRPVLRPVCTLCACAARPLSMTACMNA